MIEVAEVCGERARAYFVLRSPNGELGPPKCAKNYSMFSDADPMSLYYEAAAILANEDKIGGSLKSRIFKKKDLKSSPGQLFAIIAESSKWSPVLKDVIERTGLLVEERKVRTA